MDWRRPTVASLRPSRSASASRSASRSVVCVSDGDISTGARASTVPTSIRSVCSQDGASGSSRPASGDSPARRGYAPLGVYARVRRGSVVLCAHGLEPNSQQRRGICGPARTGRGKVHRVAPGVMPDGCEAQPKYGPHGLCETPQERAMSAVTMRQLLEAGVHFGHQTRRWNPKMKRFIFGERNGIYIIDIQQTIGLLETAYDFVRDTVADGGAILFVGTKKQTQDAIA